MRNTILSSLCMVGILGLVQKFEYQEGLIAPEKRGCLDEYATNYCMECLEEGGTCLYDNEYSRDCEDPLLKWKKRWNPRSQWKDDFRIFTYSDCWQEYEVNIYDFSGKTIWTSFDPKDKWSALTSENDYVDAGTYFLSIKAETRGETKRVDILSEFEIFYED